MSVTLPTPYRAHLDALLAHPGRTLLGLAGPPGSGKSTLAQAILDYAGAQAVVVPMDGFHLANCELARLGRAARKGAEDTFDSAGFVALLARLRAQRGDEIIYAPEFRRAIEEPVANAIPVLPDARLVIVEGNYLLLDHGHWAGVRPLLDEVWYLELDDALRQRRLRQRHMHFGRSAEAAAAWVAHTDEPNARLIAATKGRAERLFTWPDQ